MFYSLRLYTYSTLFFFFPLPLLLKAQQDKKTKLRVWGGRRPRDTSISRLHGFQRCSFFSYPVTRSQLTNLTCQRGQFLVISGLELLSITLSFSASSGWSPGGLGESIQEQAGWNFLCLTKIIHFQTTWFCVGISKVYMCYFLCEWVHLRSNFKGSWHYFSESRANLKIL